MSRKTRSAPPPPKPAGSSEVKDAAKTLGSAAGTLAKETGRTAYAVGKTHKWIPALGVGYYVGARSALQARSPNKHPYQGYYG